MYRIDECGMHSRAPSTQAFFGKWRQRHTFASFAGVLTVVLGRGLCKKSLCRLVVEGLLLYKI
jgi:hypothetical protein